jgi:hypothetical protein
MPQDVGYSELAQADGREQEGSNPRAIECGCPKEEDATGHATPEEERNAFFACGKAIDYLMKMERDGSIGLEKGSVYGAAVAIPQIARSAGWPGTLMALTIRSYLFLALNVFLQFFLLSMIGEEANVMGPFSGRMHLCDFGAAIEQCPHGPNCIGPSGSQMSYPRLYNFGTWNTRNFVRDSLKSIFPDKAEQIDQDIDPGEYGIEDYYCRLVCCFIFAMAVMNDLNMTLSLPRLFWNLPTANEKWVRFELPDWERKERAKKMFRWTDLDLVKFGVAGMPIHWKMTNLVIIFIPKLFLWAVLVSSGFHFLMETSGIVDVIMNSMALTFVLNLDELIFEVLTTVPVKHIMNVLEDYALYSIDSLEVETEEECLARYEKYELGANRLRACVKVVIPRRLITVVAVVLIFLGKYYLKNCERREDGSWISKPMFLPKMETYNPLDFLFMSTAQERSEPFWSMPSN